MVKCFDNIVSFLQNEVRSQLEGFVQATNEYHVSISEIRTIIRDIEKSANVFVDSVNNIKQQIDEVQNMPGNTVVSKDEVMAKVEQIEKSTEELAEIVNVNQLNANSIREVVERFSAY